MKKTKGKKQFIWKVREGWMQFNPHKGHPSYDEWMKLKEKEKENETTER